MNKIKILAIICIVAGSGAMFMNFEKGDLSGLYYGAIMLLGFYLLLTKSKANK